MKQLSEYTKKEIDEMRELLHEQEFDHLDLGDLKQILWDGCVGLKNMEDEQIVEIYETHYRPELED